jgi:membrane-associated phospholipid phosphatase
MTTGLPRIGRFRALVVFSSAVAVFVVVAAAVVMDPTVRFIDASVSTWVHAHVLALAIEVMIVISFLGAPSTLTAVTVAIASVLIYRQKYQQSIVLLAVVVGGNLLNVCLKHFLHRGRPVFEDPILMLPTYSFPSGHATAATVFYGLVAAYAATHSSRQYLSRSAILAAVIMIALVCFSRVYLGAHYLSDVIAGVAEGVAWLVVSLTALQYFSDRQKNSRAGSDGPNP